MGFRNLSDADVAALPGYSEFLDSPLSAEAFGGTPAASQRLLMTFKDKLR